MRRRPLATGELTEAAILADISVLLLAAGWFLPLTGVLWVVSVIPFALIVVRHRVRTLLAGAIAGCAVAFVAFNPVVPQVIAAASTGFVIGTSIKRGWNLRRTLALGFGWLWTTGSLLAVAFLALFSRSRKLTLEQVAIQWTGSKRSMRVVLSATNSIITNAPHNLFPILVILVALPTLTGTLLARTTRPALRRFRIGLLAIYIASASALNVYAGVIALAAATIAFIVAKRTTRKRARELLVRSWAANAAGTYLLVGVAAKEPFLHQFLVQWPAVHRTLLRLYDVGTKDIDVVVHWVITHWYIGIPAGLVVPILGVTFVARALARPVIARVEAAVQRPGIADSFGDAPAGPVPVRLEGVTYRFPGADAYALAGVDLALEPGTYVGIIGSNGSGKSTLARILTGHAPTDGSVDRPGSAAPGRHGGTAVVFQRPESQVLGVRVREDVAWGLSDITDDTIARCLSLVGLAGFEGRETSKLSGGELQRLAIAAALAREPAVLISDESTSMVDPNGRDEIVALFRTLADSGMTVVHITHRFYEIETADRVYVLANGRVIEAGEPEVVLR